MLQVVKKEGQVEVCPIQQETAELIMRAQLLGQLQLLKIIEQVTSGQHTLALCSVKVLRRQISSCQDSLVLLDRVNKLVRAMLCPTAAKELESS